MPASSKRGSAEALALRITVVNPPPNIAWALQLGPNELVKPTASTKARDSPGAFRLRGPAVQGRPGERFVYLCIGAYAGQVGAPAGGRAKISLEAITRKLLDTVKAKRHGIPPISGSHRRRA